MPAHVASKIWRQASRLRETEYKMGGISSLAVKND
jgi:hypothetical protein